MVVIPAKAGIQTPVYPRTRESKPPSTLARGNPNPRLPSHAGIQTPVYPRTRESKPPSTLARGNPNPRLPSHAGIQTPVYPRTRNRRRHCHSHLHRHSDQFCVLSNKTRLPCRSGTIDRFPHDNRGAQPRAPGKVGSVVTVEARAIRVCRRSSVPRR